METITQNKPKIPIKHKIMLKYPIYPYRFLFLKHLKFKLYNFLKYIHFKVFYRESDIATKNM